MTTYSIPLLVGTPQTFQMGLPNAIYVFNLYYCDAPEAGWQMELLDLYGNSVLGAIPLVTGADIFAQYIELDFGCECYVTTDGDYFAVPTFDNLGELSHLWIWVNDGLG